MSREDDLREVLRTTAQEFARYDSNPSAWQSWLVYLLKCLEEQTTGPDSLHRQLYNGMLARLQDAIRNRLRTGGW